jgi:hypothetical protein
MKLQFYAECNFKRQWNSFTLRQKAQITHGNVIHYDISVANMNSRIVQTSSEISAYFVGDIG